MGCGQNINHVCSRRCGPEDLWVVNRICIMYVAGGVDLWAVGCGQNIYQTRM